MSVGRKRGFTIVEALVAVVLTGIGVAASVNGLASLTKAQALAIERERMSRLAVMKLDDLIATGQITNVGGTFEEMGDERFLWEASVSTTGVENLSQLTVSVRLAETSGRSAEVNATALAYEEPQATVVGGETP